MKTKIILIFLFGIFFFSVSSISAYNISIFPNPGIPSVNIAYTFNFSNSTNCNAENIILSHSEIITTNSRGFGHLYINLSGITPPIISMCEYRDGSLRKNHNIGAQLASIIYSQNINVSESVVAEYFIGNGSQLTSVCLEDGTNCPAGFADTQKNVSGDYLYNDSTTIYFNGTLLNDTIDDRATGLGDDATWNETYATTLFVNIAGDTMTGDLNLSLNRLTDIGELIMAGLINSQNITPLTTNLYSLGNSTNWFKDLFVGDIQSTNINTSNLNATNIKSSDIESDDIESDRMNTTNLTVAGYNISEQAGDLVISLT